MQASCNVNSLFFSPTCLLIPSSLLIDKKQETHWSTNHYHVKNIHGVTEKYTVNKSQWSKRKNQIFLQPKTFTLQYVSSKNKLTIFPQHHELSENDSKLQQEAIMKYTKQCNDLWYSNSITNLMCNFQCNVCITGHAILSNTKSYFWIVKDFTVSGDWNFQIKLCVCASLQEQMLSLVVLYDV